MALDSKENDMSTEVAVFNDAFGEIGADLAAAMGFGDINAAAYSTLPKLSQLYKALKGEMEDKGRKMTVETIPGGYYKLETPDGRSIYSDTVTVRIFMQRFFYQRYEKFAVPVDDKQGRMYRSTMAISLSKGDMKDNYGTFNCGRPGGFIKDYKALSGPLQDIVKNTKRVMAVFGLVKLNNPTDENGNAVETEEWQPFVMNVKNRYSYKNIEDGIRAIMKGNRLPIQYLAELSSSHEMLPNGEANYFSTMKPMNVVPIEAGDQQLMKDFVEYVEEYNRVILSMWDNAHRKDMSDEDKAIVDSFITIESDDIEDVAA
jgi:hypothetical protein